MSINGTRSQTNILNRRKSNSLEKKNFEYFFPNDQIGNSTNYYRDKEYFKPRINKNRNIDGYRNNNDYKSRNVYNDFNDRKSNNPRMAYSTDNINNINTTNFVPRIVRKKKNITKYINKNKNNKLRENEEEKNDNQINIINNKRGKSIENYNNIYEPNKKPYNNIYEDNYPNNKENRNNKRNSSYDNLSNTNENMENLLCKNCFDKKMLENERAKNKEIDKIEYLNNKFINENPFYFIDKMSDKEKKRINDKIESNSNKQRLACDNYKKEMDKPKNNTKEQLQLINEYSLNPLSIEVGKDPRYVKLKNNYDKKEKIIHQNPDKYKCLAPRKAYNDYYNKCLYQVPKIEEIYHVNSVYKDNYIKALKKQIEDKRNKENEDKKKQKMAEAFANKQFNEYKKNANLNDKEKHNNGIELLKNDNKKLNDYKKYKNNLLREQEKKLENELIKANNKIDKDIKLRNENDKCNNIENYQKWLEDIDKKNQAKKDNKDEEDKKWNDYIHNYNLKCKNGELSSCDICNRRYDKKKLKKFPPTPSVQIDFNPTC